MCHSVLFVLAQLLNMVKANEINLHWPVIFLHFTAGEAKGQKVVGTMKLTCPLFVCSIEFVIERRSPGQPSPSNMLLQHTEGPREASHVSTLE